MQKNKFIYFQIKFESIREGALGSKKKKNVVSDLGGGVWRGRVCVLWRMIPPAGCSLFERENNRMLMCSQKRFLVLSEVGQRPVKYRPLPEHQFCNFFFLFSNLHCVRFSATFFASRDSRSKLI